MTQRHGLEAAVAAFPPEIADRLRALALTPGTCAFVSAAEAAAWAGTLNVTLAELMVRLLPWAASFAVPPISKFYVGAITQGASGALYPGANMEFPGRALNLTVHAEQAATTNAWLHGEAGLVTLAVNEAPCGYCRQFLYELVTSDALTINVKSGPSTPLTALLPAAFGPRDLGVEGGLMQPGVQKLALREPSHDAVVLAALAAAEASYAPYGKAHAGVALQTTDGEIYAGRYAENAAFNPSMSPLASALVHLRLCGREYDDIATAALVECAGAVSQRSAAEDLLSALTGVRLTYAVATVSGADSPAP
jgi:cytidine deaminase